MYLVIPFSVEFVSLDAYLCELFNGDLATLRIGFLVQPRMHFQTFPGRSGANQTHHDFIGFQRHPLPVARDVAEEP